MSTYPSRRSITSSGVGPCVSSTSSFVHHLVGLTEFGVMLEVSRQRADQVSHPEGFPVPEAVLASGRAWSTECIEKWARSTGRIG